MSGSVHEDAAQALLDDFMGDPDGARALQVYVAGLREDRWDADYLDAIHQQHFGGRWPMEQIAAFAHMHSDLMSGHVAHVQLTTFGATPGPDRERQANATALAELPRPFIADVDLTQHGADQDGRLRWVEPIQMELSTGVPWTDPVGHTQPLNKIVTIDPGSVPLEIGTTKASNTLLHCRIHGGVARWPYEHDRIDLFVRVTPRRLWLAQPSPVHGGS